MAEWKNEYISVNGVRLHYYRTDGNKPVVILAHGITDNGLCWTRVAKALESEFDLIMFDARGHGLSDKPEQGYGADNLADDLAGLIQSLGLDKPAVVGHSMGGVVAAILAESSPDLIRSLVLEDPAWYPRDEDITEEEIIQHAHDWSEAIVERKKLSAEDITANAKKDHPHWDDEEFPAFAQAKLQVSPHVTEYDLVPHKPWWEIVPNLKCPTLLLTGDKPREVAIQPEMADEIVTLNPSVQIIHLAGAGHNVRRDAFANYVQHVQEFLATNQ